MTTGGWITIVLSWGIIFGLVIFCYARILLAPKTHLQAPLDIETDDENRK